MNSLAETTEQKLMPEPGRKYRLITRSDMDGLVCAIILKELNIVAEVIFVHPNDMQHGRIEVNANDISTNLPYAESVYLCFDHHVSEVMRKGGQARNHIIDAKSPSVSRVVFEYFGGRSNPALKRVTNDMMAAVDQADSASFSRTDILHPEGWVMLAFIMDARTGLGRFRDFTISNYQLMMKLIDYCRDLSIDQVLALPDVRERVDLYMEHKMKCRTQIERCSTRHKNLIVLDLRYEDKIWAGNRFMIYALFPRCNISMHILRGKNEQNTVFAVGKSIINRTSNTHVGKLMLEYGGGGHENAGTCQVENDQYAEKAIREFISRINGDG
jgi:nanoRNase/pAp phosphatase (c-di-AMP/oligoRNAs hydrolase)